MPTESVVVATGEDGMASELGTPPAAPRGFNAPIQPAKDQLELISAVPETWLDAIGDRDLADRIDRLAADEDLILTLQLTNYTGSEWDYVATQLIRYGMAVIAGWMRRGLILTRCRERGSGGLHDLGRPFDSDEVEELTGETVAKALNHFLSDVLMKRRWSPHGGATLRTFFIGQCLMRFANIYRRWWGNESRFRNTTTTTDDTLELFTPQAPGVDDAAVAHIYAVTVLARVKDPRVRHAMLLTADGRSQAEIAHALGCTEKAVERMLAKQRQLFKDRRVG